MLTHTMLDEWKNPAGDLTLWKLSDAAGEFIKDAKPTGEHPTPLIQWYLKGIQEGGSRTDLAFSFKIFGEYDPAVFRRTFQYFFDKFDPIRIFYRLEDDNWNQFIYPEGKIDFTAIPIGHIDQGEFAEPFYARRGKFPDWDAFVIGTIQVDDGFYVIFNMDHLYGDGASSFLASYALVNIYNAFKNGSEPQILPNLSQLEFDHKRNADQSTFALDGPEYAERVEIIKDILAHPHEPVEALSSSYNYDGVKFTSIDVNLVTEEVLTPVHKVAKENNVSMFAAVAAASAIAESRAFNQTVYTARSPRDLRADYPEFKTSTGWFVDFFLLHAKLGDFNNFIDLAQKFNDQINIQKKSTKLSLFTVVNNLPYFLHDGKEYKVDENFTFSNFNFSDVRGGGIFDFARAIDLSANVVEHPKNQTSPIWIRDGNHLLGHLYFPDIDVVRQGVEQYAANFKEILETVADKGNYFFDFSSTQVKDDDENKPALV